MKIYYNRWQSFTIIMEESKVRTWTNEWSAKYDTLLNSDQKLIFWFSPQGFNQSVTQIESHEGGIPWCVCFGVSCRTTSSATQRCPTCGLLNRATFWQTRSQSVLTKNKINTNTALKYNGPLYIAQLIFSLHGL